MLREVRFECAACGESFVDLHDGDKPIAPVFCVQCGAPIAAPARSEAAERLRDTEEPTLPGRNSSRARSEAPKPALGNEPRRRSLAPIGALLVGFAAGIPAALLAENPLLRLVNPAAYAHQQLSEQLALVSSAIDAGDWDRARERLDRLQSVVPAGDRRLVTLRARFCLGLILANRPQEAGRELGALPKSTSGHPSVADLQRVYDALFASKPSSASSASSSAPPAVVSAAAPKPKVVVTKRELLSFARDRQHRVLLDDADRLYREVLRTHPNDAEARCGLAEVQLLRGGTDDAAQLFERALRDNPNYLPAWLGLADIDWLRGRPERAACRYRAVIDRYPAGSYPPYLERRLEQVTNSGVNTPQARAGVSAVQACDE